MIGKDDRIVEEGEWGGDKPQRYEGGGEGGARDRGEVGGGKRGSGEARVEKDSEDMGKRVLGRSD